MKVTGKPKAEPAGPKPESLAKLIVAALRRPTPGLQVAALRKLRPAPAPA